MPRNHPASRWLQQLVLLVGLVVGAPGGGVAQAGRTYEEAVGQAVTEYTAGNFEEAQALFRHAHAIDPNARTWRGLGICAFELRSYVEAASDLEAALTHPNRPLTAEQRAETQELLEKARGFVSHYQVRVTPRDAHIEVDGKAAALQRGTLLLDPGTHALVIGAPGYVEQRRDLRTGAGVREQLNVVLTRSDALGNEGVSAHPAASRPTGEHRKRHFAWTWSLASSAVAATAIAAGLRLRVNALHNEFTTCRAQGGDCRAVEQKGKNLQLGSRLSGGLAAALGVGAVVAFVVEHKRGSSSDKVALLMSPESVSLNYSF